MRILIQRVKQASVRVEPDIHRSIGQGFLLLVGIESEDGPEDIQWLAHKIAHIRLFSDDEGRMNRSIMDVQGSLLVISQFTLHASTRKGHRPSYIRAAPPDLAKPLYETLVQALETAIGRSVMTGVFGADMQVALINDGPVTIWMDSKQRE